MLPWGSELLHPLTSSPLCCQAGVLGSPVSAHKHTNTQQSACQVQGTVTGSSASYSAFLSVSGVCLVRRHQASRSAFLPTPVSVTYIQKAFCAFMCLIQSIHYKLIDFGTLANSHGDSQRRSTLSSCLWGRVPFPPPLALGTSCHVHFPSRPLQMRQGFGN